MRKIAIVVLLFLSCITCLNVYATEPLYYAGKGGANDLIKESFISLYHIDKKNNTVKTIGIFYNERKQITKVIIREYILNKNKNTYKYIERLDIDQQWNKSEIDTVEPNEAPSISLTDEKAEEHNIIDTGILQRAIKAL